jgi:hypothetical protein
MRVPSPNTSSPRNLSFELEDGYPEALQANTGKITLNYATTDSFRKSFNYAKVIPPFNAK